MTEQQMACDALDGLTVAVAYRRRLKDEQKVPLIGTWLIWSAITPAGA